MMRRLVGVCSALLTGALVAGLAVAQSLNTPIILSNPLSLSGIGGAPSSAPYYTTAADAGLSGEVVPSANIQSLLGSANYAAARALLDLEVGTDFLSVAAIAAAYQPLDADLTSVAALVTTAFGRGVLDDADAAALQTTAGTVIGTNVQAFDPDLTTYAGITPSANVQTLLGSADFSAARTNLGLAIGTNVQASDTDLTTWAGVTPSANGQSLVGAADYAAMRALLDLEAGTDFYSLAAADAKFVVGPATATDEALARYDGTTGELVQSTTDLTLTDAGILQLQLSDLAITPGVAGDDFIIEGSGHRGISILSGNTSQGNIYFGDDGSASVGSFGYDHSTDAMTIRTGSTARITADLGVLIGAATGGDQGAGSINASTLFDDGNVVPYRLSGTATYDAASLVDAAGATTTVTVTGAALGDPAVGSFSLSTQGIIFSYSITATDTCTVRLQNETAGTIDLASGTLKCWALKP